MDELKKCQFCGGEAEAINYHRHDYTIYCKQCEAETGWRKKKDAIAAWNHRSESANAPLTLDELKQMKEDGEPVWMDNAKQWAYIATVTDAPYEQVWYFTTKRFAKTVLYYHETFYRRKPERSNLDA